MAATLLFATASFAQDLNLQPFSFTFNTPIGIDFHEPTGNLIMSVNYPTGNPRNLDLVNSTTGAPTAFSGLINLTEELKIATVRASTCQGGFAVGEVFTGNGNPGQIVRISAGGTTVDNPWVILPGEPALIRGSLFQDRFCAAGGNLIVVTGNEQDGNAADNLGSVWRITSAGLATKVVKINHHLEGVITLPNDPIRYGPLAGKILAGDEDRNLGLNGLNGPNGKIWVVDPNNGSLFTVGHNAGAPACNNGKPAGCNYTTAASFQPEDLDLIRRNTDFFGVAFGNSQVFVSRNADLSAPNFRDRCGQILITQEYPYTNTTGLAALRYSGSDSFIVDPLASNQDGQIVQWEHATFTSGQDCLGSSGTGRMTGGGSIFRADGIRVTHGFELHCNIADVPNSLEINWDGGNNFHLGALTSVTCFDDPAIAPQPPNAGFDTLVGAGTGTLNGAPATIEFTLTDAGEPGTKDTARYFIIQNGIVVLNVGPKNLEKGNQQAHK